MKIAYFSPFNPLKSGISDFSEELILKLKNYVDIDIFTDGFKPSNEDVLGNFERYNIKDIYDEKIRGRYDHLVYHVGNNAQYHSSIIKVLNDFPGICELHDFSLHNLIEQETIAKNKFDDYISIMKYCHGNKGEKAAKLFLDGKIQPPWETAPLKFTLNKHVVDKSTAIIVHSDMAKQMVKGISPNKPIISIPLHTVDIIEDYELYRNECRKKLGIDENTLIFASFGLATKSKRILEILDALSIYKKRTKTNFIYYIVGNIQGINVESKIDNLGLNGNVIITGYTEMEKFKSYMGACDIAFNLRYPTQGETSASLHRLLGMGKAVIISNIGTYEEYPNEIVFKVRYDENEVNDIFNVICQITSNKRKMMAQEKKVIEYAKKNFSLDKNVLLYSDFFNRVHFENFRENTLDSLIDKLFDLNLTDDKYVEHLFRDKITDILIQ